MALTQLRAGAFPSGSVVQTVVTTKDDTFSSNGSSILRHSGLAILDGELDLDSFTDIEMGAVTINSGGILEFDNGSITIKAESLRNVGGTINA